MPTGAGGKGGHAHRFRDPFAVRMLAHGSSLYDVAKALGIGVGTAERHYSPFVRELRDRVDRLIDSLDFDAPLSANLDFATPKLPSKSNSA